jgi:molybdopterin converting factor subunit 1
LRIQVRFFGSVKDDAGTDSLWIDVPDGSRISDLMNALKRDKPDIWNSRRQLFFALNQNYASEKDPLRDNDEVAVFPMVSGGQ